MIMKVFINVLTMMVYMLIGFILCKGKKGVAAHAKSLSGLLIYVLSPALIINSFIQMEYEKDEFLKIGEFFIATFIIQCLFMVILYLIFHKKYNQAKYRILTVASTLGNVGFLGLPMISGIFPDQPIVTCYSCVYVLSMNLLVFTVGTFFITNDRRFVSLKGAILNPSTLAMIAAVPLYIFNVQLPVEVTAPLAVMAKPVTFMCMVILGMRLSAVRFKDLLTRPFVYLTCAFKLIIFPVFAYLCVLFIPGLDEAFKISVLVLSAMPAGAIISSMAELYECEQELAANTVLLTTVLALISLPALLLICGVS